MDDRLSLLSVTQRKKNQTAASALCQVCTEMLELPYGQLHLCVKWKNAYPKPLISDFLLLV